MVVARVVYVEAPSHRGFGPRAASEWHLSQLRAPAPMNIAQVVRRSIHREDNPDLPRVASEHPPVVQLGSSGCCQLREREREREW